MLSHRPSRFAGALAALLIASPSLAQDAAAPGDATARPEPPAPSAPVVTPLAHVEQRGEGPTPMVLIPGLNADWTVFRAFMDRNAARYTMYAVTLPGFGGSDPPPDGTPSWLANAVRAVNDMIEAKGLERPVLVGHGLGGYLALRLAVEHPAVPRAVVGLDGGPIVPLGASTMGRELRDAIVADTIRRMRSLDDAAWLEEQRRTAFGMAYDAKRATELGDMFCSVSPEVAIEYTAELLAADLRGALAGLQVPVLMVVPLPGPPAPSGLVTVIRETWAANFNNAPDATIEFLDDTRHFVQDDRPEKLDRLMAVFLAGE